MGADFLLAMTPMPDALIEELHHRADEVPEVELSEIAEICLGDEDGYLAARSLLHQAIDEIIGTTRRDVCELTLGEVSYVATGGMSWGDDPTDAFPYVVALDLSRITRAASAA